MDCALSNSDDGSFRPFITYGLERKSSFVFLYLLTSLKKSWKCGVCFGCVKLIKEKPRRSALAVICFFVMPIQSIFHFSQWVTESYLLLYQQRSSLKEPVQRIVRHHSSFASN